MLIDSIVLMDGIKYFKCSPYVFSKIPILLNGYAILWDWYSVNIIVL